MSNTPNAIRAGCAFVEFFADDGKNGWEGYPQLFQDKTRSFL